MRFFRSNNLKPAVLAVAAASLSSAAWAETGCDDNQPQTTPSSAFDTAKSTGTAVDTRTGLQWLRCPLGYQWQDGQQDCLASDQEALYGWTDALMAASAFSYGGYEDWRLPNKKELASIVEYQCHQPAINPEIFPSTEPESFWTSTPVPYASPAAAWSVRFSDGGFLFQNASTTSNRVRLVRDNQN